MLNRRTLMRAGSAALAFIGLSACRTADSGTKPVDEWYLRDIMPPGQITPMWEVYAYEGETATCESGHHIARFTRTVRVGETASVRDFGFIGESKYMMSKCPTCGGKVGGLGLYFFNGKLREI